MPVIFFASVNNPLAPYIRRVYDLLSHEDIQYLSEDEKVPETESVERGKNRRGTSGFRK